MQLGFAMLEVGFSRGKNVGAVVGKIMVNLGISTVVFWSVGFAIAFGNGNDMFGTSTACSWTSTAAQVDDVFASLSWSGVPIEAKFLFQVVFCAVSLAIVWGTMLDRTKFRVYVVFAIFFAGLIYPIVGHWIWGGGWLTTRGMQDFAGSSVVHLCGATAALAGTLIIGARLGKFTTDGKPRPIPGHSMPMAVFGVIILWFGWFGFNAGSTLAAVGTRFADIATTTNLAAATGVLGAMLAGYLAQRTVDVGLAGNGAIAGLVAITAPCAYVEEWAALVIGLIAGGLMVGTVILVDRLRRRRPDRRDRRARHRRRLGHAVLRPVHDRGAGRDQRRRPGRPVLRRRAAPARRPGARHRRGVRLRVRRVRGRVPRHASTPSASASTRRRRSRASTSTSTACGATPSSSCPATGSTSPTSRRPRGVRLAGSPPPPRARSGRGLRSMTMKKIEAFIRHDRFEAIRAELYAIGLPSLSVIEALGSGRQGGIVEHYRGRDGDAVPAAQAEARDGRRRRGRRRPRSRSSSPTPAPARSATARSSSCPVERAIRIRTGEEERTSSRPITRTTRRGLSVMAPRGGAARRPPRTRLPAAAGHPGFEEHHAEAGA